MGGNNSKMQDSKTHFDGVGFNYNLNKIVVKDIYGTPESNLTAFLMDETKKKIVGNVCARVTQYFHERDRVIDEAMLWNALEEGQINGLFRSTSNGFNETKPIHFAGIKKAGDLRINFQGSYVNNNTLYSINGSILGNDVTGEMIKNPANPLKCEANPINGPPCE
jgi:hypothetical protein